MQPTEPRGSVLEIGDCAYDRVDPDLALGDDHRTFFWGLARTRNSSSSRVVWSESILVHKFLHIASRRDSEAALRPIDVVGMEDITTAVVT